ncbi:MAG TPA: periplasmic heavy metal sensor [Vicinamibacteria bacterium]|jgi:Spy/CpxP family protein refolding chaperone|nr:periplasmic heavy metal sensor [Vicinamibacteria bacterium]
MKRHLLLAMGVLAAGGAALAALPDPDPAAAGPDMARMQQQAGLTDAQVTQLKKLWGDQRKLAIRRRADMAIARMEMEELLDVPSIDEKALNAKVKELSDLQAATLRSRVDAQLALRKVVTPDQHQKLRNLLREQRWRGREGPPQRGERRPGPGGAGGGDRERDDEGADTPGAPR